ncbi:TetR/AcrR family transcriptional regulator [Paraliomyxa miuraensis]|uniref:TetR/AcrR family transcriptional regulator n=1 Tax=Paraliomyxa miuraensis TaxID=376150 RepID=UPI002251131B|nr:TetR/AcrR family transcriptional regulator [Paraliomyxa miuraensis]MCX4245196.1 TetR/AcrR family transcriptional regulator [Paraliomyxa miuraensis]
MVQITAKGERARQQILDVAERLFAARGLHGTSVRDVAGELSIPTASLLHHFPRKERLYGAVLHRIAEQLVEVLDRGTAGTGDHATKLRRLTRRFWRWSQARPDHCVLLLRDMLDRGARIEEASRIPLAPVIERCAAFIREGRAAGAFRPIDPVMFVIHLAGSVSYFGVALPVLARAVGRAPQSLVRDYRRDLKESVERLVLVDGGES